MKDIYNIYVDKNLIYSGDLSEVPVHYRKNLESALRDWGDVLAKRSLNELIYSTFYWYYKKIKYCKSCGCVSDITEICNNCGKEMFEKYLYERNNGIERILDCIGMITSINITNK